MLCYNGLGDLMNYNELLQTAKSLLHEQPSAVSMLANASAFINDTIPDLNWVGFYLFDGEILQVGPFQGHVACATIPLGKGVCGEAAVKNKTMVVADVLAYDNHIACDANSRSEVVIPLFLDSKLYGVLDIDSPSFNRFNDALVSFLEEFSKIIIKQLTNPTL